MKNPPKEKSRVNAGRQKLNELPYCKCEKNHGSPYNQNGHPDLYGICMGLGFVWEVKRPGGVLTRIQEIQLSKWKEAGAIIIPHTADVDEAVDIIKKQCYR